MLCAVRVKSPFSQSALFGFTRASLAANGRQWDATDAPGLRFRAT
jgi:hypothetical protein